MDLCATCGMFEVEDGTECGRCLDWWARNPPPPACPVCDAPLVERGAALWCDRCHRKCVTCCEGAPQPGDG